MGYRGEAPPPDADGYRRLFVGDPAPWFEQATSTSPRFRLDLAAGRYILLCFLMGTDDPAGRRALELVAQNRTLFNDEKLSFFGVTANWRDQYEGRAAESFPGVRFFWDFDLKVSSLYGVVPANPTPGVLKVRRCWFLLDPMLRIVATVRFEKDGAERARLLEILRDLPPTHAGSLEVSPPVLYLPNTFEPELCRSLVAAVEADPGSERNVRSNRRLDRILLDTDLVTEVGVRIRRRVAPEMAKALLFQATRTDQHVVACYRPGATCRSERDDGSAASSRFVLTVRLNEDYDGGDISFPEYGHRRCRPPLGTALLFSSSILHKVSPIMRGECYACLSFVYSGEAEETSTRGQGRPGPEEQVTPPLVTEDGITPPPIPASDVGSRRGLRNGFAGHE